MPRRVLEAEAVDLTADGHASFSRGDIATAVDRFLRAGRRADADKRAARLAATPDDALAMAEEDLEHRKREARKAARSMFLARVEIGLSLMPGYSKPVAVFGGWTGEFSDAAELLYVANCDDIDPVTGCWRWTGALSRRGDPVVSLGGPANCHARDFAYRLFLGSLPRGYELKPTCPDPLCVSVEHVELVKRTRRYTAADYFPSPELTS